MDIVFSKKWGTTFFSISEKLLTIKYAAFSLIRTLPQSKSSIKLLDFHHENAELK